MSDEDLITPETIKIFVSVIGITLLLALGAALYSAFHSTTRINQAISTLDQISQVVRNLPENDSRNFLVESPAAWNLVYLSKNDEKPSSCESDTCLCLCDSSWLDYYDASSCKDKKGICKSVNINVIFEERNYLNFNHLPREIVVNRTKGEVSIKYLVPNDNPQTTKLYGEPKL
ncbi:MAG: hypothetical protein AABW63_02670 [Nanoarchaeota archaeon]